VGNDAQTVARLLRLVAASDGASPDAVARALSLSPNEGLDAGTMWAAAGLAIREHRDPAPLLGPLQGLPHSYREALGNFVQSMQRGDPPDQAQAWLTELPLDMRGHACSMGTVALGAKAPAEWREQARRALFIAERPFFAARAS
jgi:hypothetical protein